ncbi:MAG: hypothetical protein JF603_14590 [Acidobacteria bacterium]|nr:hypothetical protein [Acidobacteriota bacterium]
MGIGPVKRIAAITAITASVLLGPLSAVAGAMQRAAPSDTPSGAPGIQTVFPDSANRPIYNPMSWEVPSLQFPTLPKSMVPIISQDTKALDFSLGNELGSFHPAPKGGTAFLGAGQPIFGLAAPPVLPTRVLRPLGAGDAGDTFLGQRPQVSKNTVIPHLDDTFDESRSSFAFLGGPPPLVETVGAGTQPFPLLQTVAADKTPGVPDNIPSSPPTTTPAPTTGTTPGPTPATTSPPTTERPLAPSPGTTLPPVPTTEKPTPTTEKPVATTTPPTTLPATTLPPTTTTTVPPTTTTTAPPTTTTTVPAPTTTTTVPPPAKVTTAFVVGNTKEGRDTCFANGKGAPSDNTCDRLFDLSDITPGHPDTVNLTLWNADPDSDADGNDVSVFAPTACTSAVAGTTRNGGTGNLCSGLKLKVERFSDVGRTTSTGTLFNGTLAQFSSSYTTANDALHVDSSFAVGSRIFLKLTVTLPDNGSNSTTGIGYDNAFQGRTASLVLKWRFTAP